MKTKISAIISVSLWFIFLATENIYAQYQQTDSISPIYSGTINGNCFMVGNTNTVVDKAGFSLGDPQIEYIEKGIDAGIIPTKFTPEGFTSFYYYDSPTGTTKKTLTIENAHYADFCIDAPSVCGKIGIKCARLSWGGRYDTKGSLSSDVYVMITDESGHALNLSNEALNNFIKVTGSKKTEIGSVVDPNSDGFYVFHTNIGNILSELIKDNNFKGGNFRIYVANIPVKLSRDNENAGLFSGWNFAMVYEHPVLPRRSIMLYENDQFGESKQLGSSPAPLYSYMDFGDADPYNISDTIMFSYAAFGGMNSQGDEVMYANTGGKYRHDVASNDEHFYKKANKIPFHDVDCAGENAVGNATQNHFQCMINYMYEGKKCTLHKFEQYSRGYDLHKTVISPGEFDYIPKGGTSFNIIISPETEYHFLTNVLLYIGAPDAPAAALPMEVDKKNIEPDQDFTCRLYVRTGENKNGLTNIEVRVPISEYVDSITSFNISFHKDMTGDNSKTNNDNYYAHPTITTIKNGHPADSYTADDKVKGWDTAQSTKFQGSCLSKINAYLRIIDKENDSLAMANPTLVKTRELIFSFPKLIIPSTLHDTDAIAISLTLHTKKDDDPVYNKKTYVGEKPYIVPQAEMNVSDPTTQDTSIIESSYNRKPNWDQIKCDNFNDGSGPGPGSGPGGGGGCNGLNGFDRTKNGVFQKNHTKEISINVEASGNCREMPDTIKIHFCKEIEVSPLFFRLQLAKMEFELDSIRHEDSCIWEQAKRDKLINFAAKEGVNKSRLEQLLSTMDGGLPSITAGGVKENDFQKFLDCEASLAADSIDSIVNMKKEFSDVWVLFKSKNTNDPYEKNYHISLLDDSKASEKYKISQSTVMHMYYKSPWEKKGISCSDYIPVEFTKMDITDPVIIYDGDTIQKKDTIYLCLGNNLKDIEVHKSFRDYNVYASIYDTTNKTNSNTFNGLIDQTFNKVTKWSINKNGKILDTQKAGIREVSIEQKDLAESCLSDPFTFYIRVLDLRIDQAPNLSDNPDLTFCQALNPSDSIVLFTSKTAEQADYNVFWYNVIKDGDKFITTKIGEGDTIRIRKDSVENKQTTSFRYDVTFYKDHCESNPSTIEITINPAADTLKTDTITICQYYRPTTNDIIQAIQDLNGNGYDLNNLLFYEYDDTYTSDPTLNIRHSIKKAPVPLDDLLDQMDVDSPCGTNGPRHLNFVVQGKTSENCLGAGSLMTIKVNCYDRKAPKFNNGVDSILYCTGDTPINEFNEFVKDEVDSVGSNGYKWVWSHIDDATSTLPINKYKSTAYDIANNGGEPKTNTSNANDNLFVVVRIDSNSCVSEPDTFKIVVANAITSYAMIGDTTKTINTSETQIALNYCVGANPYNGKTLPTIGYPSKDYIMEWYRKDNVQDDCDTTEKYLANRKAESIDIDFDQPDTLYYCMRQTTSMGCKGPWLTVSVYVHDNVKDKPTIDTIVMCEGDMAQKFNVSIDPRYTLYTYNADTTEVSTSGMVVDTTAGRYLQTMNNSLYLAQYRDKTTGCYGEMVGANAIVNPKPHTPLFSKDTIYLCAIGDTVSLAEKIDSKINNLDQNTAVVWEPEESIITSQNRSAKYSIYQKDTVTACVSDKVEINIRVENTIKYKEFGTKEFCYGEEISLRDTVQRLLSSVNDIILEKALGFKVFLLNNNSRGIEITSEVSSSKTKTVSDTTRYLIDILDTISGCSRLDTATVIFHGLPDASVNNDLYACQGVEAELPTPTDPTYIYQWLRADGTKINGNPTRLTLSASETIQLAEKSKAYGCVDTFDVHVTVYPTPANALTNDTAFCQNNPDKTINVAIQPSNDTYNTAAHLKLQWFSPNGDSINNPIVTDTVVMNDLTKRLKYTVRQTNTSTSCFKDTSIYVTLKQTPVLNMPDLPAVCEPDVVSLALSVEDYITKNIGSTHFANTAGLQFQYSRVLNGSSTLLSEAEANQLAYINDKDSVLYAYTVTDADNVCSASDSVFVTINKKPIVPIIEGGKDTIYFCQDDAPIILHAKNNNESKYQTQIYWGEYTSTVTGDELEISANYGNYMAFTKNEKTGCVSDVDTIHAVISVPIEFSAIGTQDLCFRDSIDLIQMVQEQVDKNTKNSVRDIRFSIFRLNGITPSSQAVSEKIASTKAKNETDTTRYLIQIRDYVSGCEFQDTATIVFHGLPVIDPIDPITVCQYQDTALPTPNRGYQYEWFRETDGRLINDPTRFNSEQSESIYLKATETFPAVGLACYDSLMVSMDVREIPVAATVLSDTFCQFSGTHLIPVTRNETAANPMADLSIQWFDEKGDSIANPINTDTTNVTAKTRTIKYTIRQYNKVTGCYKDTVVPFVVNKALRLDMDDLAAVCQPEVIDFKGKVMDYLTASTTTNLSNVGNCDITYGKIINGAQTAISDAEASQIEYTNDKDSVLYTYTVVDGVCSASDSVFVTINKKPLVPIIEGGKDTIYFCQDDAPIILHAENKNESKYQTQIYWGEYTSTVTGDELEINANYGNYMAFTKNEKTGCVSDVDTIHAVISFPIEYTAVGTQDLCFRDSIDLIQMVQEQVDKNTKNSVRDIRFSIFKLNGVTPASQAISQKIASTKAKNETDTTRYLIQIKDYVSGCGLTDTATIVFHGLPVIDPIDPITVCQYQDTALPTPNRGYQYEWFRETDGRLINDPTRFNSEQSESIYLKATETFPAVGLTCYDSLMVSMDVREIPVAATVLSDTFCQLSGTHLIPVTRNETATNPLAELAIQWFDEKGDSIANPINTDTTSVASKSRTIKYTIRQYNKITGCYKDTVVPFVVNKAIKLDMEDLPAVCQPEVIDFKGKVTDYLTASTTTNITNIGSCDITYGKIINGTQTAITDAEASQIEYTSNIDSMLYTYTVVDGVCSASDSVYVTINQKPSTPIIENGLDTIYFCQSNGQLHLTAAHSNDKRTTSIFWGDHKSTLYGDTIEIPSTPPTSQYVAFSKNVLTGCVSEDDTIIVIVKEAIKVTPLGNDGTMELCAGEEINLYEEAMASFAINQTPHTTLIFNATENGYVVGENELSKVTKSRQDTSYYQFSIEDDQSKCTAENSLKLIFHQLPTFTIEGADVLCEGNDVKLEAIGDERPVSYAWKIEGDEKTLNTTASFTYKEIMKDTTFILIEKLNGTTCADTVSKKITVNVNPARLADTVISICQDTSATSTEEINLGRSSSDISSYSIQWYQNDSTLFSNEETIQVEKTKSTAFKFEVETTNRNTGCVSPRSNVTVHVNPQITIGLDNPDTICQPFTYDLITNLAKSISGGTQPTYVRTELNGTVINNETAISESGLYEVYYTDDKHCDASKTISIQFHQQPGVPQLIGDTILCQGIGDVKLTAKKTGVNSVNQTFVWKNANGETTSDTLTLSTTQYGKTRYNLFAIDLKTRCLSEPDTFDFDVRESIGFKPIGLMEACHATTVDLEEKAKAAYFGSPEEKAISYYKVNESGNLSSISDPAHIGTSGKYVTKATETISRCERMDTTEVVVYDSLAIATEGSNLICQGEEVAALSAINADSYTWYRENGDNATGAEFPYAKDVTKTETFRLIGEKKIGSLYCQDSIDVTIKVNANPITLSDTIFRYCQDTAGIDQPLTINKIERENETIELVWTDEQGETIFNAGTRALTSIKDNGETRYYVHQKNTKTQCTSEKAAIDVTVLPQIRVSLKDTTTCEPNIINLVQLSEKAGTAEDHTSDINVTAYELMQNGAALDKTSQAEAITESGQYRITFQYEDDGLTCQSTGTVRLTFNRQPNRPNIADQNFCQNTGDYELEGKTNTADVQLLWEDLSLYPSRQDTGKSTISTEIATQKLFLVRQVHTLNGCVSEADSAMVTVYPAITAIDKDTAICYGESVDLNLFAQSSYQGGTPKYSVTFKNRDGQNFDAENVTKSNTYFAYFSDSMNVCQDTATLIVDVNQPIILSIAGGGDACTGQTVTLTAEGAEQYEWSNGEKTPSIALTSEETGSRTLSVEGRSMFHDIYCYADTSVEIIFHNAVKPRELTFDTCARNIVTIDDIVRRNNVTEHIDTIWNITDNIRYSNLSQNIGKSGQYEVAVHNDEGCAAHHTLTINMHQVDNLKVEKQESTYCYGSLANFTATGENAREYEWENLTDNTVTTGATYNEPIYEWSKFRLIATEKELGCKDTIEFSVDAFPKKELTITGNKNACRDSLVILSVEDALIDVRWKLGDSIMTEKNIRFIADHNDSISVSGIDENGCLTTESFIVNVAYLEDPAITYSTIDDTEYALSDDVKEVEFKETTTPAGSDLYTFTWSFGDGRTWIDSTSNEVSHVYNDTLIHSRRDIPVELIVEHQYGCKKSTSTILKIDPFLFVPNTMIADGSYIFMENYDVQIYDRVGTLIYQGNGWDGTYKGEPASEDTYFYSLTYFEKGEKKLRTGYITVVR